MSIRILLSAFLAVLASALTPSQALSVEITYSVGYWSHNDCRLSPQAADPLTACRLAWPGFDAYEISIFGGKGNMAEPFDPYVPGPTCIGYDGSRYRQIVKVCASVPLEDNLGEDCDLPYFGNPINAATGNKFQKEVDYSSEKFGLSVTRFYNSSLGHAWRFSYTDSLEITPLVIAYSQPDGRGIYFEQNAETWTSSRADVSLKQVGDHWELREYGGLTKIFDEEGKLLTITSQNGSKKTITYSDASTPESVAPEPGLMIGVEHSSGKTISYSYDESSRIDSITDLSGLNITYSYDSVGRLSDVTYPDETTRTYLYNEPSNTSSTDLPSALTGIIGEGGDRSSTFKYDSDGRAVYTAGRGSSETFEFEYNDSMTVVTGPSGTRNEVTFEKVNGRVLMSSQTRPGGHSCSSSNSSTRYKTYTPEGWVKTKTDWKGNVTEYTYDTRGREISRTEAVGTSEQRSIQTEWHPTLDRKVRIVDEGTTTVLDYDNDGNLISERTIPNQ